MLTSSLQGDPVQFARLMPWTSEAAEVIERSRPATLLHRLQSERERANCVSIGATTVTSTPNPPILMIIGPPRAATTALHHALAAAAPLNAWWPRPVDGLLLGRRDGDTSEKRHIEARHHVLMMRGQSLAAIHRVTDEGPEECNVLHKSLLGGYHLILEGYGREYFEWWSQLDKSSFLLVYHGLLRTIAPPDTSVVILKSPFYMLDLPQVRVAFPLARGIWIDRETSEVL